MALSSLVTVGLSHHWGWALRHDLSSRRWRQLREEFRLCVLHLIVMFFVLLKWLLREVVGGRCIELCGRAIETRLLRRNIWW